MLDFCYATLEEVPHGLELQCNLRYRNLDRTRLKEFPSTMLFHLSNLQFLCLHQSFGGFRSVEVGEVAGSRKLESLKCHFFNLIDFNKSLQQSLEERQLLGTFILGQLGGHIMTYFILYTISKKI